MYLNSKKIATDNGIPRFTPNISYSTGNFSKLREEHASLQLDSINGTNDRLNTILSRTKWPKEFFNNKLILECGCGAGADTEILRSLGATVVSVDIAGVDIAKKNLRDDTTASNLIIQASITDLPFKLKSFDVVWCHRVLQHTPSPENTLRHILNFVRDDGAVFVHSYSRRMIQTVNWKYALRPITKRINNEKLYKLITWYAPKLYYFSNFLGNLPPEKLGRFLFFICSVILPIRNYRFMPKFKNESDEFLIEYAIHDTFDALSPLYDWPIKISVMRDIAETKIKNFEIVDYGITLLRSVIKKD